MDNQSRTEKYCFNCGQLIYINAEICPKCGTRQIPPPRYANQQQASVDPTLSDKDWLTTLLLCLFLGYLGVHRFYVGNTGIGLVQLFTGGGCGVWSLIDLVMIITGKFKDEEGKVIKDR